MPCSAKPNSSSSRSRAPPKASPSAGAKSRKTPIEVSAGSASQSPAPGGASPTSGTASSAGPASRAACSLAATSSSTSGLPVRATVPAAIPAPPSTKETTTACRERIAPLVVRLLFAQRRLASELSTTKATCPSALEAASAFSTTSCGRDQLLTRPPRWRSSAAFAGLMRSWMSSRARSSTGLLDGVEDVDALEQRHRAAVADRGDLPGLGLAAVEGAAEHVGLRAADHAHRAPEVRRRRLVGHVAQLAGQLPALDPVEALAGELEVVALHVDRPALVADDVDAALDAGDDLRGGGAVLRRLQRDVGHPLHRRVLWGVGKGTAVGAVHAAQPGRVPVDLVADQHAVAHDVPPLAGDALVVPPDGGQPVRRGAVPGDVHDGRPVPKRA